MTTSRLLTLAVLLALVATPLAARAVACCGSDRTACCAAGAPCSESCGSADCRPQLAACSLVAEAPAGPAEAEAERLTPEPLPLLTAVEESPPRPAPADPPQPRSSLFEAGSCLHTTLLPPPVLACPELVL